MAGTFEPDGHEYHAGARVPGGPAAVEHTANVSTKAVFQPTKLELSVEGPGILMP